MNTTDTEKQLELDKKLIIAITNGRSQDIQPLIDEGACVDALECRETAPAVRIGYRPLDYAIETRNVAAVDILLKNGASIEYPTPETRPELYDNHQDKGIHRLLVSRIEKYHGLALACSVCDLDIVKLLVEHGAAINTPDNEPSPLSSVLEHYQNRDINNAFGIIKYLIDKGADVNAANCRDKILRQSLWKDYGEFRLLRLLLENGIDLNSPFESHANIDQMISDESNDFESATYLIDQHLKREPSVKEREKYSLDDQLIMATGFGNMETVDFLVSQGANVHAKAGFDFASAYISKGNTALEVAVFNKDIEMFKHLSGYGFPSGDEIDELIESIIEYHDLDMLQVAFAGNQDHFNEWILEQTLINIAENFNLPKTPLAKFLLDRSATVDLDNELSALFYAVDNQSPSLTKLLLESGNIVNATEQNLASLIKHNSIGTSKNQEIADMLEDYCLQFLGQAPR